MDISVILASSSPRRKEILNMLGFAPFTVSPPIGDEPEANSLKPDEAVRNIALAKLYSCPDYPKAQALIIACDTLVYLDGEYLGKPKDKTQAKDMLRCLSGKMHSVYSGLAIAYGEQIISDSERTDIYFRPLSEDEICRYVESGESEGKAGAYAAQGRASLFISKIDGDFWNVVGLPVYKLGLALKQLGLTQLLN